MRATDGLSRLLKLYVDVSSLYKTKGGQTTTPLGDLQGSQRRLVAPGGLVVVKTPPPHCKDFTELTVEVGICISFYFTEERIIPYVS